jgi:gliding motility-associated protein GldM
MSLPKEPRQKMINIMYLVLTALLALNVSKQIVHAFVVVNTGLQQTNNNTVNQNAALLAKFQDAYNKDMKGTAPFWNAANLVKTQADAMVNYIQDLKVNLVKKVDGKPEWKDLGKKDSMLEYVDAKEDFTTPTGILCGEGDDITKGKAHELKVKLSEFRRKLADLFKDKDICPGGLKDSQRVTLGLLTPGVRVPDEGLQTWEYYYFGETPLVSDVVAFTQLQNDVRNAESSMLNYFYSNIGASDVKVSTFIGKILPASTYVLLGDSFKADIFPTAIMKTKPPTIEVGDTDKNDLKGGLNIAVNGDGVGRYALRTDKEGPQMVKGLIRIPDPLTGQPVAYPFSTSYIVAKAAVVVSPTEMNVFYAGIDNPVDVSAPGFDATALHPSVTGGSMRPSGAKGHYLVNVSSDNVGREVSVNVSASMPDGSHKTLPAQKFRVKRIPDPSCATGGRPGDVNISKLQLAAIPKVQAQMPADFSFAGVNFTVVSFTMAIQGSGGNFVEKLSNSGNFTGDMLNLIKGAPKGTYVIIKGVQVRGPDGKTRTIQGQAIHVN